MDAGTYEVHCWRGERWFGWPGATVSIPSGRELSDRSDSPTCHAPDPARAAVACLAVPFAAPAPTASAAPAATVRLKAPSGFEQRLAAGRGIAISAHLPDGAVGRSRGGPAWRVGVVGWLALAVVLAGVSVSGVRRERRADRTPTTPGAEVPPAELVGLRADWGWPDLGAILAFDLAVRGTCGLSTAGRGASRSG
ncbi:hypothetical protein GEV43_44815 [Actinomadura sp. J1-007]|uniref:hypothetical protein n=1 Tax=Actinomadura sp. J1-007 TaxID=2661913 RepID=UPI0013239F0A|nr:hypothetical protein [Actinomadura sp. J1-007]MWK40370.1 hypothetical protein [Actinomadura sp. J1-007]